MTAGWRECSDPVELAAAVAAGVEVRWNKPVAVADAVGRGQWDWWIVAVLVVAVLVAQVVAVATRGPLGKEGDSDE